MILDTLSQSSRYNCLGPRFEQGFRYLASVTAATPLGRHELDGPNLFALVQTYPTRPLDQCRFEAHRQYADIQFIIAGQERILWAPLAVLGTVTDPYNAEKDIAFFGNPKASTPLNLGPGQFAIFYPTDGHAPGALVNQTSEVRKVVIKVRLA